MSYKDKPPLKTYLQTMLTVFTDLIRNNIFPNDWMVMRMVFNNVILTALQYFAQALNEHFLKGSDFDHEIWNTYFKLAVAFVTQECLQLDVFSAAKRDKIKDKYGDMRVPMGFEILTMWQALGDHKINFIPKMVGPFLEVTLVPETELRRATLPILFDMMQEEQKAKSRKRTVSSTASVESELIDKLDILVSQDKGDDEYRQLFENIGQEVVAKRLQDKIDEEAEWKESGTAFIKSVTKLLERLLDYRRVMKLPNNCDIMKTLCTVNLLNFYKNEIAREEMYIRYIYKLCDLHLIEKNYNEAGFILLRHAELLSWSDKSLVANLEYPAEKEWQRKEKIYRRIIEYFDKGKAWEYTFPLCKELANLYETKVFNYKKLSMILKLQASFYINVLSLDMPRLEPSYFRVGFYGRGLPSFIRTKSFVIRGREIEKLCDFQPRTKVQFPGSMVLSSNDPPDDDIKNTDGVCLQICNVKPVAEERSEFKGQNIDEAITVFYTYNEVIRYRFDRPFHRGKRDPTNEFKTLCLERTVLTCNDSLPGILKLAEVIDCQTTILSPIENAIETMSNKNKELNALIFSHDKSDRNSNHSPLTMALKGTIQANVNGGISMYQQAFFTNDFMIQCPEDAPKVAQLKALFLEQLTVLEKGLDVHGRLTPTEMLPLHDNLIQTFATMKDCIKKTGSPAPVHPSTKRNSTGPIIDDPVPRVPRPRSSSSGGDRGTKYSIVDDDPLVEPPEHQPPFSQLHTPLSPIPANQSRRPQSDIYPRRQMPSEDSKLSSKPASDPNLNRDLSTDSISLTKSSSPDSGIAGTQSGNSSPARTSREYSGDFDGSSAPDTPPTLPQRNQSISEADVGVKPKVPERPQPQAPPIPQRQRMSMQVPIPVSPRDELQKTTLVEEEETGEVAPIPPPLPPKKTPTRAHTVSRAPTMSVFGSSTLQRAGTLADPKFKRKMSTPD